MRRGLLVAVALAAVLFATGCGASQRMGQTTHLTPARIHAREVRRLQREQIRAEKLAEIQAGHPVTLSAPTGFNVASARTGAKIACRRGPAPPPGHTLPDGRYVVGNVPAPGKGMGWVNGMQGPGIELELSRGADGSLYVGCAGHN